MKKTVLLQPLKRSACRSYFTQIEIKPTIVGRIADILFKPSQLKITLELNNGLKRQYRIIAGMAKSGFVISPLIENTAEFKMLYGKDGLLDGKPCRVCTAYLSPDPINRQSQQNVRNAHLHGWKYFTICFAV